MRNLIRPTAIAALGVVQVVFSMGTLAASGQSADSRSPSADFSPTTPGVAAKEPPGPAQSQSHSDTGRVCFGPAEWLNPCHKGAQMLGEPECPPGPPKHKKLRAPVDVVRG